VEVVGTVTRRGMHEACAGVFRDVIARQQWYREDVAPAPLRGGGWGWG
jgi:hypothetical protein